MSPASGAGGPAVRGTAIDGLLVVTLPVHGDQRGWFKENWQREKMVAAGLPDFIPVQNNISFNEAVGTTRGIHAEPWDKYVSVASGAIFGAWVDLREGPGFGTAVSLELGPGDAVFVPRGVGNAFQTLEPGTAYSYLVTDHWSAGKAKNYTFLNLADESAGIGWPIPLSEARLSEADQQHPRLGEVTPMKRRKTLVLGAGGQLGKALARAFEGQDHVEFATRAQLDISDPDAVRALDWSRYETVINAAAFTGVDAAQTPAGRSSAWAVNATGVAALAAGCARHGVTLVQVSSDYVFDGTAGPYRETDPFCPLGVYGQSKAAGDCAAATAPRHYIVRTSWVVGEGKNFVDTMAQLAATGVDPNVIDDQRGRLTFTADLAAGIVHLVETGAPFGTYNLSSSGPALSWAGIAREVFRLTGHDPDRVTAVDTGQYQAGRQGIAPRPADSTLCLDRIEATGFIPGDQLERLAGHLGSRAVQEPHRG